jgi:hypothetical protein
MARRRFVVFSALVLGWVLASAGASASQLLITDTSTLNSFTFRPSKGPPGIGQGVSVETTYVLDHFDMMLALDGKGHIKFMIWDDTNSTLLYSGTETAPTSPSLAVWVSSPTLNFTINSGNTYFFGVIADTDTSLAAPDWFLPPYTTTQNGLTLLKADNSNYSNFASPQSEGNGSATFPLRLYGDPPAEAVPEPASIVMACLAIVVGGLCWRRHRRLVLVQTASPCQT